MCKRHGGEKRGNSKDRRARKWWMLSPGAGFGGDGVRVACVHCSCMLDFDTVEADRRDPRLGYARVNVQPSCRSCNLSRSNNGDTWVSPLMRASLALAG